MATEEQPQELPTPSSPLLATGTVFGVCFVIGLVLTTGYVFFIEPSLQVRWADNGPPVDPANMSTPWISPGLRNPKTFPAAEAKLDDADLVIGIVVDGRSRAYQLKVLSGMSAHVVNDLIKDVPVTVTYCDRADCARAYTSTARGEALGLGIGGMVNGRMLLHEQYRFYFQDNGRCVAPEQPDLPYQPYPHEVITWKAWREAHPDTDVYYHEQPAPAPSEGPGDPLPLGPNAQPKDK